MRSLLIMVYLGIFFITNLGYGETNSLYTPIPDKYKSVEIFVPGLYRLEGRSLPSTRYPNGRMRIGTCKVLSDPAGNSQEWIVKATCFWELDTPSGMQFYRKEEFNWDTLFRNQTGDLYLRKSDHCGGYSQLAMTYANGSWVAYGTRMSHTQGKEMQCRFQVTQTAQGYDFDMWEQDEQTKDWKIYYHEALVRIPSHIAPFINFECTDNGK